MSAETEFPMTAADLRKRVVQLRHLIDQGEIDDDKLLDTVFGDEGAEWIEENLPKLHAALQRVEQDYEKLTDASQELEASQDAVDAMVQLLAYEEERDDDDEDEDEDDEDDEGEGDDDDDEE